MINRVFGREAEVRRLREEMVLELAQLSLAVFVTSCLEVASSDESADAAPGLDYAQAFKLGVDPGDGVCVNPQVNGELTHGRELIAYGKLSRCDLEANCSLELMVERRRMRSVNVEGKTHLFYCTTAIVQIRFTGVKSAKESDAADAAEQPLTQRLILCCVSKGAWYNPRV